MWDRPACFELNRLLTTSKCFKNLLIQLQNCLTTNSSYNCSVHFNQFYVQFYVRWRRLLPHNSPTSIKRYRTLSSLLNSASEIPWRMSFSSITEQTAVRLVCVNWGSCSLLLLKSLWLGPALISATPMFLLLLLLEIRSPFSWPKYDFKPRHPVTTDFFITDKKIFGWIWFMTLLEFRILSPQYLEIVVVVKRVLGNNLANLRHIFNPPKHSKVLRAMLGHHGTISCLAT